LIYIRAFFVSKVKRTDTSGFPDGIQIFPFYEVVRRGKNLSNESSVDPPANAPLRDDNAIIMFTSGSTGVRLNLVLQLPFFFKLFVSRFQRE